MKCHIDVFGSAGSQLHEGDEKGCTACAASREAVRLERIEMVKQIGEQRTRVQMILSGRWDWKQ